jgi:hypothetical protein
MKIFSIESLATPDVRVDTDKYVYHDCSHKGFKIYWKLITFSGLLTPILKMRI